MKIMRTESEATLQWRFRGGRQSVRGKLMSRKTFDSTVYEQCVWNPSTYETHILRPLFTDSIWNEENYCRKRYRASTSAEADLAIKIY